MVVNESRWSQRVSQVQAPQGEAVLLGIATESWGGDRYGMLQIPVME